MPADSCQLRASMTSCPHTRQSAVRTVVKIDSSERARERKGGEWKCECVCVCAAHASLLRATIPNRLVASNGVARSKQNSSSLQLSVFLYLTLPLSLFLSISVPFSRFCFVKFMSETRSSRATLTNCIKNGRDELKIRAMNSLCHSVRGERESQREQPSGRVVWAFSPLNIVLFCCCLLLVLVCFVCFSLVVVVVCFVAVVSALPTHVFVCIFLGARPGSCPGPEWHQKAEKASATLVNRTKLLVGAKTIGNASDRKLLM